MNTLTRGSIVLLTFVYAGFAYADADDDSARKHRKPPQVAIDACAASVEGDPCAFTGRRDQEVSGSCVARDERPLACRPDSPPPGLYREKTEEVEAKD